MWPKLIAEAWPERGTWRSMETAALIDWPRAAAAKLALLRHSVRQLHGRNHADNALQADFAQFRADGGELLMQHAVFEALHAVQSAAGISDWRQWPLDLRDPASATVAVFAASHEDDVRFHASCNGWRIARCAGAEPRAWRPACASV